MTGRRVCLFTGVSGTLGRDFVARHGAAYDLVGVHLSTPPSGPWRPLVAGEPDDGPGIRTVRIDLSLQDASEDLAARVVEAVGPVDLLVNAACFRDFGSLVDDAGFIDRLEWQLIVNAAVPARLASALMRLAWMGHAEDNRAANRNVVNLSSTAGRYLYPGSGQSGYAASKAALDMITRHQADEFAPHGIRVNGLAPNTFPGIVTTASVSDAIVALDAGAATGTVTVIDRGAGVAAPGVLS